MGFTDYLRWDAALSGVRRGAVSGLERLGLRTTIFILVCLLASVYGSYALFLNRDGELVHARGNKPTSVLLEGSTTIGQSFRARANGLDSVELRIGRMNFPLDTDFRCELLRAEGDTFRPSYRWLEHLALPSSGGAHRFSFAPVATSKDQVFRFTVRLDRPGLRIPIEASVDNVFDGGAMIVNDREEWGDLVFATGAMASTPYGSFRMTATELPSFLRPVAVQVALLALVGWAWLYLLYWLFVVQPEAS